MRYQSIKNRRAFQWIYSKGSFLKGKWVSVRFCDVPDDLGAGVTDKVLIAISVSKKVAAKATVRNRWKRRIREITRLYKPCFIFEKFVIFQVRASRQEPIFADLKIDIEDLFQKIAEV